jgi:hypothetical protein
MGGDDVVLDASVKSSIFDAEMILKVIHSDLRLQFFCLAFKLLENPGLEIYTC